MKDKTPLSQVLDPAEIEALTAPAPEQPEPEIKSFEEFEEIRLEASGIQQTIHAHLKLEEENIELDISFIGEEGDLLQIDQELFKAKKLSGLGTAPLSTIFHAKNSTNSAKQIVDALTLEGNVFVDAGASMPHRLMISTTDNYNLYVLDERPEEAFTPYHPPENSEL